MKNSNFGEDSIICIKLSIKASNMYTKMDLKLYEFHTHQSVTVCDQNID